MENSFLDNLIKEDNYTLTENGAVSHKSTLNKVYDMFALGGAYRARSDNDCIVLFKNAYTENPEFALKCLFYLRDVRGGQGERRFFRVCFAWLANNYPDVTRKNLKNVVKYGRWDDLFCLFGTNLEGDMLALIKEQLIQDIKDLENNQPVSLLAKWIKSENTHSKQSIKIASKTREYLGLTKAKYRKTLSALRKQINIVERLMSLNNWDNIEFDKLPSKAGLLYRNVFARREETAERYNAFINSKETKVNAATLYPYDVVHKAHFNCQNKNDETILEKYWNNLPDYLEGKPCKLMCVVDTSSSMTWGTGIRPLDVAISLGIYCAERIGEPFKDHYVSFSSRPQLVKIEGVNFVDKVDRLYRDCLCENTDLHATFDLLLDIAKLPTTRKEDLPDKLVIISDMEIDVGISQYYLKTRNLKTEMELIREEWAEAGFEMPQLIYWNVNARDNLILDNDEATYVSGCSPVLFKSILSGKSGIDIMLDFLSKYTDVVL